MQRSFALFCALALPAALAAQTPADFQALLERMDKLEQANRALLEEVHALRSEIAAGKPGAPLADRLEVQETRTADLAQSKVESTSHLPITITGMALFNAFWTGRAGGEQQYPTTAQPVDGRATAGGTLRQSEIGFRFQGPEIAGGGKVSGSLYMDLFGGSAQSLNHLLRLRVAGLQIDWKNTTILAGQDKPIIAPREPTSLAQVGVSPLTAAGNLWLWQPQIRVERRVALSDSAGLRAQAGLFQTSEGTTVLPSQFANSVEQQRPGWEGRLEFWGKFAGDRRIEIAPGYHYSQSHLLGASVPSRIFSADWLIRPEPWFDFTGAFFTGENVAVLGALRQGIVIANQVPHAVHSTGGWAQATWRATGRLSFNVFTGQQDDRNRDLAAGGISRNLVFGANALYRIAPNVIAGFEGSTIRTTFLGRGTQIVDHYDLDLAYQF